MAVDVRYRNFFIPRVVKNLKISPWEEKAHLPRACGPWEVSFFFPRAHFWRFFQPLGWRNFYTRHPAHSEIPYFPPGDECAWRFHGKKMKRYRNLSMAIAYIDSYRNSVLHYMDVTHNTSEKNIRKTWRTLIHLMQVYTSYYCGIFFLRIVL